jgi:hypothetical protein
VPLTLLLVALIAGGIVWAATRAHRGTGKLAAPAPARSLTQVQLCQSCAHGFNPLGSPSDEHPEANLAVDNQLGTYWNTQSYVNANLNKAGTGLYVDAKPRTTARVLRIITATPGFTATVYARNDPPPLRWPDPGWVAVSAPATVASSKDIPLSTGSTPYRYFLVWITSLGGHNSVAIDEVALYK